MLKSIIIATIVVLCPLVGICAESDQLIVFSTIGPDKYKDGQIVLDGEKYALVLQKLTSTASVIDNLGGSVNQDAIVLRILPLAKNGRCPTTVFQVNQDYLNSLMPNAKLALYLLDTRLFSPFGKVSLGNNIQGWKLVSSAQIKTSNGVEMFGTSFSPSELCFTPSIPKITRFLVDNTSIEIVVTNLNSELNYGVIDKTNKIVSEHPITGNETNSIKFLFKRGDEKLNFFKVVRY